MILSSADVTFTLAHLAKDASEIGTRMGLYFAIGGSSAFFVGSLIASDFISPPRCPRPLWWVETCIYHQNDPTYAPHF